MKNHYLLLLFIVVLLPGCPLPWPSGYICQQQGEIDVHIIDSSTKLPIPGIQISATALWHKDTITPENTTNKNGTANLAFKIASGDRGGYSLKAFQLNINHEGYASICHDIALSSVLGSNGKPIGITLLLHKKGPTRR
jgi:hypothetical protein